MNFSNKIIVFLLGLSLGLLAGAGFFIFKIDDYLSKLEFFKSAPDTVKVITETKGENTKPYTNYSKTIQKTTAASNDSVKLISDSLVQMGRDSFPPDTVIAFNGTSTDEIVVKKDELLSVKNIDVVNYAAENKNPKDSILQKESGIKEDKSLAAFKVEFW